MKKEKLQELLLNPASLQDDEILQLQQVVKDYPYFHNAHLLLLYGLHHNSSDQFESQLSHSALNLSSRTTLVNAIIKGWKIPGAKFTDTQKISKEENLIVPLEKNSPDIDVAEKELEIETQAVNENTIIEPNTHVEASVNETSFEDNFSFSLEDAQPIETMDKADDEDSGRQDVLADLLDFDITSSKADEGPSEDLIDHFLKVNPRIVPKIDPEDARGDISIPGLEENDEIVTETLADIYEQQGHFLKAKEAYQKLILKFPEKSAYFASRIQNLEKHIK